MRPECRRRARLTNSGRTPISSACRRAPAAGGFCTATGRPAERPAAADLARQHVHARRADEVADEGVPRPLEQLDRRADLDDHALMHHHDLVGEGERLGLVVGDVDHGPRDALVQLLELGAQLPLEVRVDHGQRLVEHDDVDVRAHQPAAERDLLLAVGGEAGGAPGEHALEVEHAGDLVHPGFDLGFRQAAVAQRERQIVVDRHGVVDDRELEHLGDVAPVRRHIGEVDAVEQHAALGRPHQAGDDVEQRGLAAARWPEQRIGAAVRPVDVELLQRPVLGVAAAGAIAVAQISSRVIRAMRSACTLRSARVPSAAKYRHWPTST